MKILTPGTHSDLYIKVHKIHDINEEKDYIKLNMSVYYKSCNSPCSWLPRKNYKLIYSGYKHFKVWEIK